MSWQCFLVRMWWGVSMPGIGRTCSLSLFWDGLPHPVQDCYWWVWQYNQLGLSKVFQVITGMASWKTLCERSAMTLKNVSGTAVLTSMLLHSSLWCLSWWRSSCWSMWWWPSSWSTSRNHTSRSVISGIFNQSLGSTRIDIRNCLTRLSLKTCSLRNASSCASCNPRKKQEILLVRASPAKRRNGRLYWLTRLKHILTSQVLL